MSKKSSDPLTRGFEKRPVTLTIWATSCEGGRIVCRAHVVRGPFQIATSEVRVPLELLARCIVIEPEERTSWR